MRDRNSEFFYDIDLDDNFRVRNVFWVDARCRAAYESFGDVVSFDTTYLTNKYDMPFAPIVGVNHHGQSTLLGCGLLSSEDTTSFVWLFKTWLRCISFVPPQAIITDQCKAIKCAIEVVFPAIRHRWCLWHIMKKIPDKFKGLKDYNNIKHCMKDVVYEAKTKNDFEVKWNTFIAKFALHNNDWLSTLYNERHQWVPCFLKDSFWAGMSTTQRSESMNAFFDGYIHSTTSLQQFVSQYDNALQHKIQKEYEADFHSLNTTIRCGSHSMLERQFQLLYTHAKFVELQVEFRAKMNCSVVYQEMIHNKFCYNIMKETITNEKPAAEFEQVTFEKIKTEFSCTCKLFEFKGIICRHALVVLANERVMEVPRKYIMERWCKNVKRRHANINTIVTTHNKQPRNDRFDKLCKKFYEVTEYASESLEKTNCLIETLKYFESGLGELYNSPTTDKS